MDGFKQQVSQSHSVSTVLGLGVSTLGCPDGHSIGKGLLCDDLRLDFGLLGT
jgi:hypothetical protein